MDEYTSAPPSPTPDDKPAADQSLDLSHITSTLQHGTITRTEGRMRWGSNYAALITIEEAGVLTEAVYKPQRGERPLWDFATGTLCYREWLSYLVSEELGWQLVPPTALRNGPHGIGSVQLFIPHDVEVNYFTLGDNFIPQLKKYALFDAIVNNADRKGGHLLLDGNNRLWGIDHGLTFHTLPKLRTVIWDFAGEHIDNDLLVNIHRLHQRLRSPHNPTYAHLKQHLSSHEVEALMARIEHLLECQIYPRPGPGPSFPWPPV